MCGPNFITRETNPGIKVLKIIGMVILGIIGAAAFAFLFGYFVMLLWNWLMPEIFENVKTINFWQAVGIVFLARLVFGGFKHSHDKSHKKSHRNKKKWSMDYKSCGHSKADKWKYYDDYWKDRGEQDFDDYVKTKEKEDSKE